MVVVVAIVSVSISVFNYLCTLLRNVRISIISYVFEPSTYSVPIRIASILVEAPPLAVGSCNTGFAACCRAGNLAVAGLAETVALVCAPGERVSVGNTCYTARDAVAIKAGTAKAGAAPCERVGIGGASYAV
jgi:hypothetical protein